MRLLGILIAEFRSIREQQLPAEGLVVLFGPNSAGKTSVLEAVVQLLSLEGDYRKDPAAPEDAFPLGVIQFALPDTGISSSPDGELFRALLTGELGGGDLTPEAIDHLRGSTAIEAREWIASGLVARVRGALQPDREILARSILDPSAMFLVTDNADVAMCVDASRLPVDAIEAARRIAADAVHDDPLGEIADSLVTSQAALIAWIAEGDKLRHAFPPVFVLDGDPESLSVELRKILPVIHNRLWDLHYRREPTGGTRVDEFAIRADLRALDGYSVDNWLERMSPSGEPEIPRLFAAHGQAADWYRVRRSVLAVAAMIEEEANRLAPGFLQSQGQIGVEVLPVSVWGAEDRRVRATFTGPDGERRDLRVVGAGTARWTAAAVQLACRRLEQGTQVVTDQDGTVISDLAAVRDIVQAARTEPLSQGRVRLEPADAPGIYIVDEPEAHLHPASIASVRAWLEELARTATAVLIATHSPILLDTDSPLAARILMITGDSGTKLHPIADMMDDRLAEAAGELGITKGDLLLMGRLAVFVEGPHDVIILTEWFGNELRYAGIHVFPAHGGDNFEELVTTKPGLVGSEIIAALGIRMAVIMDKSPTRVEPAVRRLLREAEQARTEVAIVELSEDDILFYLDEQVCKNDAPSFPGWHAARNAFDRRPNRAVRSWKKWISETYGLNLSLGNIRRLAAECKRQERIPEELKQVTAQLAALAVGNQTNTGTDSSANRGPYLTAGTVSADQGNAVLPGGLIFEVWGRGPSSR